MNLLAGLHEPPWSCKLQEQLWSTRNQAQPSFKIPRRQHSVWIPLKLLRTGHAMAGVCRGFWQLSWPMILPHGYHRDVLGLSKQQSNCVEGPGGCCATHVPAGLKEGFGISWQHSIITARRMETKMPGMLQPNRGQPKVGLQLYIVLYHIDQLYL